jgi:DMSO/TMAO reductase YedYZ molybdopterin-dependent catalytic subunit
MLVDDAQLDEKNFPLKLVGAGLEKKQMVGGIALIELMVPALEEVAEEEVQETKPAPVVDLSGSEFVVTGMVKTPTGFTEETLRALDVVKITAEHPKSGSAEYEGVRLSDLLGLVGVKDSGTTLVITADDGFSSEVSLAEVLAIPDCLLAFTETTGKFKMVMPGLPSNTWVKGVVSIEVK